MNILLDTNILILIARDRKGILIEKINPDKQKIFVSIVSIGELKSIALQNGWGPKKWQVVNGVLEESVVVEINEDLVDTYSQIDSYSQIRNPFHIKYPFPTPRNMGKNDLWIASTATFLGLRLITIDTDFNHLHKVYLDVHQLSLEKLLK